MYPKSIKAWLLILLLLLFVLIIWGAIVRLTGSGLSIPEWPIVNGSLLPPLSDDDWQAVYRTYYLEVHGISDPFGPDAIPMNKFKTMFTIEYLHRLLAALAGLIFVGLFVAFMRNKVGRRQFGYPIVLAGAVLLLQIILGAVVVKEELKAELVAFHLATAYIFYAILFWIYLRLSATNQIAVSSPKTFSKLAIIMWLAVMALFSQIISGGLMAGSGAGYIMNTFPKMGDHFIPPLNQLYSPLRGGLWSNIVQNQVLIQFFHRWWILAVIAVVIFARIKAAAYSLSKLGRFSLRAVDILLVLQILMGIGNLMMKVPVYMSAAHSGIALLLFTFLIAATHEARFAEQK